MISPVRVPFDAVREKTVRLTGGLNEQIVGTEMEPGELVECVNYIEQPGRNTGYISVSGYERFDGTTAPSSVDLDSVSPIDDTSREAARAAIGAVPGSGVMKGIHVYNDKEYAFRGAGMYVSSATYGWGNGAASGTAIAGTSMATTGTVRAVNGRFSLYNTNLPIMAWVDGVSENVHIYNGTTVTVQTSAAIGGSGAPTHIGIWRNRLFVAFPEGHILFSKVGDPTDWDSSAGLAGEIYIGDDITNIKEVPGGVLAFFTNTTIKFLYYGSTGNDFVFKLDDFTKGTGAREDTVEEISGTLYFADKNGFKSLETTTDFGDFSASSIGDRVANTYDTNFSSIDTSLFDRSTDRYYLFYTAAEGSQALVYTFYNKRLKSVSKVQFLHKVIGATSGTYSDGSHKMFFYSSDDAYIRQLDSGTSFDGSAISETFTSTFHHYNTVRRWKSFHRLGLDVTTTSDTVLFVKLLFDYKNTNTPTMAVESQSVSEDASLWGLVNWDGFVWDSALLAQPVFYLNGYATTAAVYVATSSAYNQPHIIHNFTMDYSVHGSRR